MRKKLVGILLAFCLAGALTACDKKDSQEGAQADAAETPGASAEGQSLEDLELEQYVKLGTYKGIQIQQAETSVTDEEVEAEINARMAQNPLAVPEGIAEEGDLVNISYVGRIDGETFEGGSGENQEITIGSKRLISGFEEGLVGMKTGETKELNLTFPEDYNEELGGKAVVFTVTLNQVSRTPETLTQEWVQANSQAADPSQYREQVRGELETAKGEEARENAMMEGWKQVVSGSEILKYPDFLVEEGSAMFQEEINYYAQVSGMELKEFLAAQEITEEEFQKQCEDFGESIAAQKLVMQAIKEAEGMTDQDQEAQELLNQYAQEAGMTTEGFLEAYGQEEIYQSITLERVCSLILENASA
ncbi:MAG TPA: trigger factor [Candidatus Egerieimonas intestinavium]|uniref:peptidylprolyl isomerase n=1 Tax=Candidatus Egerieimonas intestinavium TaxID=2840777 RepID=A0A9D1EIS6_9FIRM|nr:trigger factor [Candidatus Egerieimonas intestinavium]